MELSQNSGSCFNQHKDVSENGLAPIKNEMFSFGDGEISSPSLTTIQFTAPSSSAEFDAPASDSCIEAKDERGNLKCPAQGDFDLSRERIEETYNQILSSSVEELNASVFVRGKQIALADFNEDGAGCHMDISRNEDMLSGECGGQEFGEEEIKSEASSCNAKGFIDACEWVGQEGFGPGLSREMFDHGVGPVQEAVVEPNMTSVENLVSPPIDKLSSARLRDITINYVIESTKFVALLMENLLQLPGLLKGWASQTLVKPSVIPTLVEKRMDKNEADNFASGGASTIELQQERENIYTEDLVGAIGFHLGMSIATVLAEILASNYCLKQNLSAEEISELLGFAIRESLNKVLGSQCNHLVRDFEVAFTSTYKTITRVKQAHYEKKMTSRTSEKNTLISDGQMPGLATDGSAKGTPVEYADALENPGGNFREDTDCLVEQTSGSLGSVQGSGMKGGVQQFHKRRFAEFDMQITSNGKDKLPKENCRLNCITESVNVKDHNNFTCQTNQLLGNVSPSHPEMGVINNEIEEISQKLENLMFDSAECKDFPMGNIPSVATDTMACTGGNIEENDSDLVNAINENCIPSSMSSANLNHLVVLNGHFDRQPENTTSSIVPLPEWTQSISNVFEKSLMEQERCNKLREVEIALTMRRLHLKEAKMYVDAESNKLTRQSIAINQSIASFKENKFIDKKMNNAYVDLNRTCADNLVAGLILMLFALAYGSWKYSHVNLSQAVQVCHNISKESQKSSWFYNPINSLMGHFQTLICEFVVIGRILFGLAVIAFFATSLLRRTVSSSSQIMPTSIILIFLGLICGYAGKLSVDSLGGSGFHWLVQWEVLCLLHAFSAYFPASLLCVLNGPPSTHEEAKEKLHLLPLFLRKFIFHVLLLVLPVMAGLTPFASVREWINVFSLVIFDNMEPVRTFMRDSFEQFLGV